MDIPKAEFITSIETEKQRLVHTAKQIWSGFYEKKGFSVLPYLDKNKSVSVYYPKTGIEDISNIENILSKIKLDFPLSIPDIINRTIKFKFCKVDPTVFKNQWQLAEKDFWHILKTIFPKKINHIKRIEVRLTNFGTISSYQFLDSKDSNLIVYLRKDADISNLAESIITCLISSTNTKKYQKRWIDNEFFVDTLLTASSLAEIFPRYDPTSFGLSKKATRTVKNKSRRYLIDLGVKTINQLDLIGKKIYLNGKTINNQITQTQFRILEFMLHNDRYFTTTDQLSGVIWKDDEDFSMWALNKAMQRLRNRLIFLGASKNCLEAKRGRGYLLNI